LCGFVRYDEHDPSFSSETMRSSRVTQRPFAPVVHLNVALLQPPHAQHDAQLRELALRFREAPALAHLPFERRRVVVVNRNLIGDAKYCKRCVPAHTGIVSALRRALNDGAMPSVDVVEVLGSEPYLEQVKLFRSAAVVLAPHGAALTSMLHCAPGAAVFEILHAHNLNRQWFMIMAAKLGLDYWAVLSNEPNVMANAQANARENKAQSESATDNGTAPAAPPAGKHSATTSMATTAISTHGTSQQQQGLNVARAPLLAGAAVPRGLGSRGLRGAKKHGDPWAAKRAAHAKPTKHAKPKKVLAAVTRSDAAAALSAARRAKAAALVAEAAAERSGRAAAKLQALRSEPPHAARPCVPFSRRSQLYDCLPNAGRWRRLTGRPSGLLHC